VRVCQLAGPICISAAAGSLQQYAGKVLFKVCYTEAQKARASSVTDPVCLWPCLGSLNVLVNQYTHRQVHTYSKLLQVHTHVCTPRSCHPLRTSNICFLPICCHGRYDDPAGFLTDPHPSYGATVGRVASRCASNYLPELT
jgi:hypothetical protein